MGNYSSVHECESLRLPAKLTPVPVGFTKGFSFKPGHVTSIEPGFYLEDRWGMRIESVYICKGVEVS